jgi:hypothetical protein
MAGIYGTSMEDRHFERMLDKYLDERDNYGMCKCDVSLDYDNDDIVIIAGTEWDRTEITESDDFCPECGEKFDIDIFD